MANDGKIYITISDKRFGQNTPDNPAPTPDSSDKETKEKESPFGSWLAHQYISLVKHQVMSNINFAVNNIGNFTGDYEAQRDAQLTMSLISELTGFGIAVQQGYKMGGAAGAGIAIGVYAINKTVSTVQQYNLINLHQKQNDYSIQRLRDRSGLNSRLDGSRGTEN